MLFYKTIEPVRILLFGTRYPHNDHQYWERVDNPNEQQSLILKPVT